MKHQNLQACAKIQDLKNAKIIFLALNGIGNTLLLTPVFTSLKKAYPRINISVLALADSAGSLKTNPNVDNVIVYPGKKGILSRLGFLLSLRKKKFDISFYPYPNVDIMSALFGLIVGARCRVNFEYKLFGKWSGLMDTVSIPVEFRKHDVEKNLEFAKLLGVARPSQKLFINVTAKDRKKIDLLLKGKVKKNDILVGMHVGSKEGMRVWPTENFARLVAMLSNKGQVKIVLVGTEIEKDLIKGFEEFAGNNIINLINETTIPETTALIERCKLFVTNDSAPMHMAVSVSTKVIAIYLGPNIMRTGPYGKEHVVFLVNMATKDIDSNKNHHYVKEVTPEIVFKEACKALNL
jgi:ADP-heptose:LPS heptosyltransferase